MYHLNTNALELQNSTFQYITSQQFSPKTENSVEANSRLRAIADQSFDLLAQVQKMEKLSKLGHLSQKETMEYNSLIRLVGIMIHILQEYKYADIEMMDALMKRYHKNSGITENAAA